MSKERQKARAAREAARRIEVEEAARQRAKQARRKAHLPTLPRRRKRYGALPLTEVLRLVVIFLMFQAVVWFFVPALAARISLAVLSAACLGVYVTTRRSTTR